MAKKGNALPTAQQTGGPKELPALLKIPAFPPIAIRMLHLLANENVAVGELLEPLRADPAFSAEILRRANSAMFGFRSQVNSLQHALVVLGLRRIRTLTMTVATGIYLKRALQFAELRRCWRHTLACALLTEELARACLVHLDLAYTAGLLHDIGRLGLLVAYPAEYSSFLKAAAEVASTGEALDFLDQEKETFGLDHCEAGHWLAGQWKLPEEFAVITGRHHDRPSGAEVGLLTLVYLGCQMADTLGFYVVDTRRFPSFEELCAMLPESAQRRFLRDPATLEELIENRLRSYDMEEMSPPLPVIEEETRPPASWEESVHRAPGPAVEATPAEVSPPPPPQTQPRASTFRRDLVAALVTCLVAGTLFFWLLRWLAG
jgi:putative nucleotidyltransferase with HDIG domain